MSASRRVGAVCLLGPSCCRTSDPSTAAPQQHQRGDDPSVVNPSIPALASKRGSLSRQPGTKACAKYLLELGIITCLLSGAVVLG